MGQGTPRFELSADQHRILSLILSFFNEHRRWPTYRWLNQLVFVESGLNLDEILEGIPVGHVLPEPTSARTVGFRAEAEISLTLRGVHSLEAEHELDVFLATLRHIGETAATFIPSHEDPQELTLTSAEAAQAAGCDPGDPALGLARELISNSVWEIWSGSGSTPDGAWQLTILPEKARAYRAVASVGEVLEAHAPLERQRQSWAGSPTVVEEQPESDQPGEQELRRTVFVVYGRNGAARTAMFVFLESLGLEPLDWDKLLAATGEASPYIGEVLAAGFPMAQAVVVLLTPDDLARVRPAFAEKRDPPHEIELTPQARPNVLFEAGMAFAIHPTRTVLVELGELRAFSDVAGRHALRMNDSVEARRSLIRRLQTAECFVDLDGEAWKGAGDFTSALALASSPDDLHLGRSPAAPARFALVEEASSQEPASGPVTLRVENEGESDEFEATVVNVRGSKGARAPWYVRWRNSTKQTQEILTGHSWLLELCEDQPAETGVVPTPTRSWLFLSPETETAVLADGVPGEEAGSAPAIRITVKVTPRGDPSSSLENTVTLSLSERGRVAVWDRPREK